MKANKVKKDCAHCGVTCLSPIYESKPVCWKCNGADGESNLGSQREYKEAEVEVRGVFQLLTPCPYLPGTKHKIEWMRCRASLNVPVHQKNDRRV